jgi:hypothetical protein
MYKIYKIILATKEITESEGIVSKNRTLKSFSSKRDAILFKDFLFKQIKELNIPFSNDRLFNNPKAKDLDTLDKVQSEAYVSDLFLKIDMANNILFNCNVFSSYDKRLIKNYQAFTFEILSEEVLEENEKNIFNNHLYEKYFENFIKYSNVKDVIE